jgi:hypothetical protein
MTTIWGTGPTEYRFFWHSELRHFSSEGEAKAFVERFKDDSSVMGRLKSLVAASGAKSGDEDELIDALAGMLIGGRLIAELDTATSFEPIWRYYTEFRERAFALNFLARFRRDPIAMARLRGLLRERNLGANLSVLTVDQVCAGIANLLATERLVPGFYLHAGAGGSFEDEKSAPPGKTVSTTPAAGPKKAPGSGQRPVKPPPKEPPPKVPPPKEPLKEPVLAGVVIPPVPLKSGKSAEQLAAEEKAIKASGMVPDHARKIANVARARNEVIIMRRVNPDATALIEKGAGTKSMHIKGKSSDWGPHAGFIPVDAAQSKLATKLASATTQEEKAKIQGEIDNFNKLNQEALDHKPPYAVAVDLVKDGKVQTYPDGTPIKVLADPTTKAPITADYDMLIHGTKDLPALRPGVDPEMGKVTNADVDLVGDIDKAVQHPGGKVVHHGPSNQYFEIDPKTGKPVDPVGLGDWPATAMDGDGNIVSINSEAELKAYMNQKNAEIDPATGKPRYYLEPNPGWAWTKGQDGQFQ